MRYVRKVVCDNRLHRCWSYLTALTLMLSNRRAFLSDALWLENRRKRTMYKFLTHDSFSHGLPIYEMKASRRVAIFSSFFADFKFNL